MQKYDERRNRGSLQVALELIALLVHLHPLALPNFAIFRTGKSIWGREVREKILISASALAGPPVKTSNTVYPHPLCLSLALTGTIKKQFVSLKRGAR